MEGIVNNLTLSMLSPRSDFSQALEFWKETRFLPQDLNRVQLEGLICHAPSDTPQEFLDTLAQELALYAA